MTKQQMLQGTILSNRAIQQQARTLNVRAGEVVFPVWTREEWQSWLAPRLKGAISAETLDVDDILLPQLPADEIQLVMDMNPDTIEILGKEVSVEYREPYYGTPRPPQARLRGEFVSRALWNKLPDEGVKLPGGRTVSVLVISDNGYTLAEGGDIPALKLEVKNQLNRAQWNEWTSRPEISVPTEIMDETALPEIIAAVYGKCVVTGEPLVAYGVPVASRYWSSDQIIWKPEWFRVRAEAETAFSKAKAELEKAKVETREKREREAIQKVAATFGARARELYGLVPYECSGGNLRNMLYERAYSLVPSSIAEIKQWTIETEAIIAQAEVVVAESKRKQEEAEAERLAGLAKENENLLRWARPILMPEEDQAGSGTLYGMPCRYDTGPCDPKVAEYWGLYSYARDEEKLGTHKGFRSSTTGKTLVDLVVTYMKGDGRLPQVLARMRGQVVKPAVPTQSINPQPVQVEDAVDALASMWGARRKK